MDLHETLHVYQESGKVAFIPTGKITNGVMGIGDDGVCGSQAAMISWPIRSACSKLREIRGKRKLKIYGGSTVL